jgi:acetone carboxylase gamma subunit
MLRDRIRIHESLTFERDSKGGKANIKCLKCNTILCDASQNYKEYVPYIDRDPKEVNHMLIDPDWMIYREYYCPNCAILLEVDPTPPEESPIWDIQIKLS